MGYVPEEYRISYQKVFPASILFPNDCRSRFQILIDSKTGGKLDGLPFGRRINARNAVRNDGKRFLQIRLPP